MCCITDNTMPRKSRKRGEEQEEVVEEEQVAVAGGHKRCHGLSLTRIKALAQEDQDIGRMSQVTLACVATATAAFASRLVKRAAAEASSCSSKVLKDDHIRSLVMKDALYDFLRPTLDEPEQPKPKRRRKAKAAQAEVDEAVGDTNSFPIGVSGIFTKEGLLGSQAGGLSTGQVETNIFEEDDDYD